LARLNREIKVVDNQFGTPTSTKFIVNTITEILKKGIKPSQYGIYHLTPSGNTSWYEFAKLIHQKITVLDNKDYILEKITPVNSSEFKTNAARPTFSILDNKKIIKMFKIKTNKWEQYLDNFLGEIK
jgi:dTDP-4-dehydrorhamnose reductase